MSVVVEIPALRIADGPSVAIQDAQAAGTALWAVSIRDHHSRRRDRWFGREADALAFAIEHADALGLLLLDLRHYGEPQ